MKKNFVLIGTLVLVAVMFAMGMFAFQGKKAEESTALASKNAANLVQFYSPSSGAADAKVTLVEFFDPSCEACRAFYPLVKSILEENKGKLKLVLRYAAFHKDSDIVVKMLEATKAQNLYWQSLEAVLISQPEWADHGNPQVDKIWTYLKTVGVDIDKAKEDMKSPAIENVLKQDTADVAAFQVQKTPTFYVNGKPLLSFSEDALRALVKQEIVAAYK
jgi:protein-disulfide isomerase